MKQEPLRDAYDVIVIGGGVNGCGITRDCAMRGLNTLLLEKGDLASGTSGASSGMIHGGLRYLLHNTRVTRQSSQDSGYIRRIAPHLCFRIPFIYPILKEPGFRKENSPLMVDALFSAYDHYQPLKAGKPHTRLSRAELTELEPGISDQVASALTMDEWGIDVFRLCVANAMAAELFGAQVRIHHRVERLLLKGNNVEGVQVRDLLSRRRYEVRGRIVFNAAGPWIPQVASLAGLKLRLRPAKGVHLIFDRRLSNSAILAPTIDGRQIFIMPHENVSWLGTTDDDFYGDPDHLEVTQDEIGYLIEAIGRVFPAIYQSRLIGTAAGIRPTLFEQYKYEDDLTREHEIFDHESRDGLKGLLTMAGGKLASYRIMAEEATDVICGKLGVEASCQTHSEPLPGGARPVSSASVAEKYSLSHYATRRLIFRHGEGVRHVLDRLDKEPGARRAICPCEPTLEAEVRHVIRHEWARTLEDLRRRVRIAMGPCQGAYCVVPCAAILAEELGWDMASTQRHIADFLNKLWRERAPILNGKQLAQEEIHRGIHLAVGNWHHIAGRVCR